MELPLHNSIRVVLSKIMKSECGELNEEGINNFYFSLWWEWNDNHTEGYIWADGIQHFIPEIIEDYDNPENDIITPYHEVWQDFYPIESQSVVFIIVNSECDIIQDGYFRCTRAECYGEDIDPERIGPLMFSEAILLSSNISISRDQIYRRYISEKFLVALQCVYNMSFDILYMIYKELHRNN